MNMVNADRQNGFLTISTIIILALIIRILCFSGFVLGDDPSYADDARMISDGRYPPLCDLCVFSFRPVLLYSIGLSLKWLGWSEFNFVLPILLSSLISIYLIYRLAELLFDKHTGLLAALLLSVYPLEVVHATTMSNDIMLGMLVALSMLLMLKGLKGRGWMAALCFASAGASLGIATGVKINAIPIIGLFVLIGLYSSWKERRFCKGMIIFLISWVLVQAVFSAVYYLKTGDYFAHIHAELIFNKKFNPSGFANSAASLKDALLYYPRYMLCLKAEGHPGYEFYPYGLVYPVFLLGVLYLMYKREEKAIIPLIWFAYLLLMMEFTPLRISPYYQPIHRLIRFLSIISIPALLVVAYFVRQLFRKRLVGKTLALLLIIGLFATSLHQAYRKSYFYADCMSDARKAYAIIGHMPYKRVITDHEMKVALIFHNQLNNRDRFKSFECDKPQFSNDSLVILGGARRPDIHHQYVDTFVRSTKPQTNWVKIGEVEGKKEAWRKSNLVVYRIVAEDSRTNQIE
jgi:4-amino-4-deoxy-L-arabinose transferase-like glycosyltransferase